MKYATVEQVEAGFRTLDTTERLVCDTLLTEAAVMIDAVASSATTDAKQVVSCRMVRRAMGNNEAAAPMGATQGSVSALGYSQSWTFGTGSTGELYIGKSERSILGVGNKIGISNPFMRGDCSD